jgi:hypothetical protein
MAEVSKEHMTTMVKRDYIIESQISYDNDEMKCDNNTKTEGIHLKLKWKEEALQEGNALMKLTFKQVRGVML